MNKNIILRGFVDALGVVLYVSLVGLFFSFAPRIFGEGDNSFLGSIAFLTLLVLSVATVGSLIFLKPAMLYLGGEKKEGVKLLAYTLAWLFVFILLVILAGLLVVKI